MYIPLPSKVHIPQTKGGAKAFALMWRIKHIQNGTCLTPTWSKSCVVKLKNKFIEINPNRSLETDFFRGTSVTR